MKYYTNYTPRNSSLLPGTNHTNKHGCVFTILGLYAGEQTKNKKYVVKFIATNSIQVVDSSNIKAKSVKDYMHRSVFGVGYMGKGKHSSYKSGKVSREYKLWNHMLERCYGNRPKWHTYKNVSVCGRWHNFQNFCEDLPKIAGYDKWLTSGWVIDKDLSGGLLYSLENCVFLSPSDSSKEMNSRVKKEIIRGECGRIVGTVVLPSE